MNTEIKKIRPDFIRRYDQREPKLSIKSSLPHVKSALAFLILVWESLDSPSEVVYSKQEGTTIVLADDVKKAVIDCVSEVCPDNLIDSTELVEKINDNPFLKSQLESLIVAFELIWKLASISFVGYDNSALERKGGKRFPKKLNYSSNIDIIHCLIESNKTAYFKVLLGWIGLTIQFDDKVEKALTALLSLLSEGAVFKLMNGTNSVIFNQNGLYLKLLETRGEVDINGDSESKGSLRILKSLLSEELNPHLHYSSGNVTLSEDIEKLENYQRRVDTFLGLSSIKDFEIEEKNILESSSDVRDNREENRISTGENILLYGVPGSGKSWTIAHEYCNENTKVERLVFHPDYTYAEFVGQILPDVTDGEVTYKFTAGPFTSILRDAYQNPNDEYLLIIEEINRGNAPAIFGEIFQLLDRMIEPQVINGISYPAGTSEYEITNRYMAIEIYGDENHKIRIPSNLSIIGTMNTSDQNVFTLDTAFQRRWNMRLIENSFDNVRSSLANAKILDTGVTWQHFCETVNDLILENKNKLASAEDKRLGVYFVHEKDLLPYDFDINEYKKLLSLECDLTITADQKKTLKEMREIFKQNRKFAEKVIKYLWDDAFKFNAQDLFDSYFNSLESVIRHFVFSSGQKRFEIFQQNVRDKLLDK